MAYEYKASGSIELKGPATLKEIEEFCAEARRLGVRENDRLFFSRQGLTGTITCLYFSVAVIPKSEAKYFAKKTRPMMRRRSERIECRTGYSNPRPHSPPLIFGHLHGVYISD
jgi:hypothetical protein